MEKKNFLVWYYGDGLKSYLKIWGNFIRFCWNFFSAENLFFTLFSPWKKDITLRTWIGLDLIKSTEILINNVFSRFMGVLVRSLTIVVGLFSIVLVAVFGAALLLVWILPPLVFVLAPLNLSHLGINIVFGVLLLIVFFVFVVIIYKNYYKSRYEEMSLKELSGEIWFDKVCGRLGKKREEIDSQVFENKEKLEELLRSLDLSSKDFQDILSREIALQSDKERKVKFWLWENLSKVIPVGKYWQYAYTVNLDKYSADLTRFDPTEYRKSNIVGHAEELEVVKLTMERPNQNNILLVGDPGMGKRSIVHQLAKNIREGNAEYFFRNKRIIKLDLEAAIAEASNRKESVEGLLRRLFNEAAYAENVILVIEDIDNFLGKDGGFNISSIISEYLPMPTFKMIAVVSTKGYHKLVEKHKNLMKFMEVKKVLESNEAESMEILYNKLNSIEREGVIFTHHSLKEIIKNSERYNGSIPLPERAIDLAMEVLVFWKKNPTLFITDKTVDKFLSIKTGISVGEISEEEKKKLLNLEDILHERVIGQNEAIRQIAEAMRRSRSGIGDPKKPVGKFLFMGPTGVGKTETSKALAEAYFGDEEKMIRLDMSEFQDSSSIHTLIGNKELDQPGRFTSQVKDNPFSLILLDEIEKAYPEILNLFLQVLDEGYITDAFGSKINFRNSIIIATSNAGAQLIKKMIEEKRDMEDAKREVIDFAVDKGIFRVEFINRFDDTVLFHPLKKGDLKKVTSLLLAKFARRVKGEKNIEIEFDDRVVEEVIEKGYEPIFGARSINRYIGDNVEDLVAKKIIEGSVKEGEKFVISI